MRTWNVDYLMETVRDNIADWFSGVREVENQGRLQTRRLHWNHKAELKHTANLRFKQSTELK